MVKLNIPYGRGALPINVPDRNLLGIAHLKNAYTKRGASEIIREALTNPINSPHLSEMVDENTSVSIVVTDKIRPCPENLLVSLLLEEIEKGGCTRDNITVVIANGLHEPASEKEKREMLGNEVVDKVKVINHDARKSPIKKLGVTRHGHPVEINKIVADSDIIVTTGLIEPHFFAGFSGGRKSILPGVASRKSILNFHNFHMIGNKKSAIGALNGNPTHEDALDAARLVGVDFILNIIINEEKNIVDAVAGDLEAAYEEGVKRNLDICRYGLSERPDIVVTSNSGYPLDLDLYQAVKGMDTAASIIKEGGTIVMASECRAGVGPRKFYELSKEGANPDEILDYIRKNGPIESQWQNQRLCSVLKKARVKLKSRLPENVVRDMLLEPIDSLQKGLEDALVAHKNGQVLIIPSGPLVLPFIH